MVDKAVIIPRTTRAGTLSIGSQKDTHDVPSKSMLGR